MDVKFPYSSLIIQDSFATQEAQLVLVCVKMAQGLIELKTDQCKLENFSLYRGVGPVEVNVISHMTSLLIYFDPTR